MGSVFLMWAWKLFGITVFPSPRPWLTQYNTLCLLLFLSIFIAFILEAFFVAYSLEKSEVETAIEKKIQELGVGVQE